MGEISNVGSKNWEIKITYTQSRDIPKNVSTINCKLYVKSPSPSWNSNSNEVYYTIQNSGKKYLRDGFDFRNKTNEWVYMGSYSFKKTHASDGSLSFPLEGTFVTGLNTSSAPPSISVRSTVTLTSIPRKAKITSRTTKVYDEGTNPVVKYNNPVGSGATLELCISIGDSGHADIPYRLIPATGNSYTFVFNNNERNTIRSMLKNTQSSTAHYTLRTEIGGQYDYDKQDCSIIIKNGEPVISNYSVQDVNSATVAVTGNSSTVVSGESDVVAQMSVSYKKSAFKVSETVSASGHSLSAPPYRFNNCPTGKFIFQAKDSRGLTDSKTLETTVIPYRTPTCEVEVLSNDPTGSGSKIVLGISGRCFNGSFGATNNKLTIQYRYKISGSSTYGNWINVRTGNASAIAPGEKGEYQVEANVVLNDKNSYTFQARTQDSLHEVQSLEVGSAVEPIADWNRSGFKFNVPVNIGTVPLTDQNMLPMVDISQEIVPTTTYAKNHKIVCYYVPFLDVVFFRARFQTSKAWNSTGEYEIATIPTIYAPTETAYYNLYPLAIRTSRDADAFVEGSKLIVSLDSGTASNNLNFYVSGWWPVRNSYMAKDMPATLEEPFETDEELLV